MAFRRCAVIVTAVLTTAANASAADPSSAPTAGAATAPRGPTPRDYDAPSPDRGPLTHVHAAANLLLISYLVWQYDWIIGKNTVYNVTGHEIFDNLKRGVIWDDDSLTANFVGHPYSGAVYFEAARSLGLGFWESTPYALGGSIAWELASEWQAPAANDLITTTLGGIALGEIMQRLSSLALDDSKSGFVRVAREVAAAAISPARGVNRVLTGAAWSLGEPPKPKRAEVRLHLGADQVEVASMIDGTYRPSGLVALDADYGELLPETSNGAVRAYEFFDFYGAGLIGAKNTSGVRMETLGMLHGWSVDLSKDDGPLRDNHVPGFVQGFDLQDSNFLKFAALGLGFGDVFVWRSLPGKRIRLGVDAQWTPLAAAVSPVTPYAGTRSDRDYNFTTGASAGLHLRANLGRLGELGARVREHATTVINGTTGAEIMGHGTLWYEVDIMRNIFGLGVAPTLTHRWGDYIDGRTYQATQLSLQLYATVHL